MSGLGLGNISEKQEKAIIALLNQPTIQLAAKEAGVGERTLHTWLDLPHFVRAYCRARKKAFSQAVSLAQKYAPLAVQTLARICNSDSAPPASRVAAAAYLLRLSRDSIELEDLQARLDLLEQAQGAGGSPQSSRIVDADFSTDELENDSQTPGSGSGIPPAPPGTVQLPPPKVKRGRKPGKRPPGPPDSPPVPSRSPSSSQTAPSAPQTRKGGKP